MDTRIAKALMEHQEWTAIFVTITISSAILFGISWYIWEMFRADIFQFIIFSGLLALHRARKVREEL